MSKDYKRFADILMSLSPEESLKGNQDWLGHLGPKSKVGAPWREEIKKDPELVKHLIKGRFSKYYKNNAEKVIAQTTKYQKENAEKFKAYQARYRKENLERINEYQAKYRKENPEKVKAYRDKYYQNNVEKINAKNAKYRKENPEKLKDYFAKYNKNNAEKIKARNDKYRKENVEKVQDIQSRSYRKKSLNELINFKRDETRLTPKGDIYAVKGIKHSDEIISQEDLAKKRRTNLFLKSLTSKFKKSGGGSSSGSRGGGLYIKNPFIKRPKKD